MDPNLIAIYLVVALRTWLHFSRTGSFPHGLINDYENTQFGQFRIVIRQWCLLDFLLFLLLDDFEHFIILRLFLVTTDCDTAPKSKVSFAGLLLSSQVAKLATVLFNESNQKKKKK